MITVQANSREYTVRFVPLSQAFAGVQRGDVLITDENLAGCYPSYVESVSNRFVVPAGEESKSFSVYQDLVRKLAAANVKRSASVYAFGGGVVGDLAGFVAASYMRGVRLVQIPTSLLAMVDSSVGGKVGIDLPEGKNLVGAFWAPHAVNVSLEVLKTLPERQFVNGMAEVWKYGWITDSDLLGELEAKPLSMNDGRLEGVVSRCIEVKKDVVEEDEHEQSGLRAILNFGHTIGHAIEKVYGYDQILHGEAISMGMVLETRLAERLGYAGAGLAERVERGLQSQGLPTELPEGLDASELVEAMKRDKKADDSGLAFSLVTEPGACKLFKGVSEEPVLDVLRNS